MKRGKNVVFITGAGRGLGNSIALSFLEKGYYVFATKRFNSLSDKNDFQHPNLHWHDLDVTQPKSCELAINKCIDVYGRIDVLINNASGNTGGTSISEVPIEDIEAEVKTTLIAPIVLSKIFVNKLKTQGSGKVIFVSSISGLTNQPGNEYYSVYSASKSALIRFSQCLCDDIRQYGMQSHVIVPCNIREGNFSAEKAVSFDDVSALLLQICDSGETLSCSEIIISPAN